MGEREKKIRNTTNYHKGIITPCMHVTTITAIINNQEVIEVFKSKCKIMIKTKKQSNHESSV